MRPKAVVFISGGMFDSYRANVAIEIEVVDLDSPMSREEADRIVSECGSFLDQRDIDDIRQHAEKSEALGEEED